MNRIDPQSPSDLEAVLRRAPTPAPPGGLEDKLMTQIHLEAATDSRNGAVRRLDAEVPFWRRWWPVAIPSFAVAALAATTVIQQAELNDLERRLAVAATETVTAAVPETVAGMPAALDERAELERLRALLDSLLAEVGGLEALRQDNEALKAALAAALKSGPPEVRELTEARERAARIQCVNNLKQLGLAVRVWATDNKDEFPPDVLSLTNEIEVAKVLICPADPVRKPADSWANYSAANCSYEFLSPGPGNFEREPQRVMWRCPIHGTVTLCDGSVQQMDPSRSQARLESHDGGLYFTVTDGQGGGAPVPAPAQGAVVEHVTLIGGDARMSPELMKRYGLTAAQGTLKPMTNAETGDLVFELEAPKEDGPGDGQGATFKIVTPGSAPEPTPEPR